MIFLIFIDLYNKLFLVYLDIKIRRRFFTLKRTLIIHTELFFILFAVIVRQRHLGIIFVLCILFFQGAF